MKVICYTDGSCRGNPGPGGWAYSLSCGAHQKFDSGSVLVATNNQMELMAALEAVRAIRKPCTMVLRSDSAYLVSNFSRVPYWRSSGWIGRTGAVKNRELWDALDTEVRARGIDLRLEKVQGHAGEAGNEQVNAMAQAKAACVGAP